MIVIAVIVVVRMIVQLLRSTEVPVTVVRSATVKG